MKNFRLPHHHKIWKSQKRQIKNQSTSKSKDATRDKYNVVATANPRVTPYKENHEINYDPISSLNNNNECNSNDRDGYTSVNDNPYQLISSISSDSYSGTSSQNNLYYNHERLKFYQERSFLSLLSTFHECNYQSQNKQRHVRKPNILLNVSPLLDPTLYVKNYQRIYSPSTRITTKNTITKDQNNNQPTSNQKFLNNITSSPHSISGHVAMTRLNKAKSWLSQYIYDTALQQNTSTITSSEEETCKNTIPTLISNDCTAHSSSSPPSYPSFAITGYGVPPQLLMDHLFSSYHLLELISSEKLIHSSIPPSSSSLTTLKDTNNLDVKNNKETEYTINTQECSFQNTSGDLSFDWMCVRSQILPQTNSNNIPNHNSHIKKEYKQDTFSCKWPLTKYISSTQNVQHSSINLHQNEVFLDMEYHMDLFLNVMMRLATSFASALDHQNMNRQVDLQDVYSTTTNIKDSIEGDIDCDNDDFTQTTTIPTKPKFWKARIQKSLFYSSKADYDINSIIYTGDYFNTKIMNKETNHNLNGVLFSPIVEIIKPTSISPTKIRIVLEGIVSTVVLSPDEVEKTITDNQKMGMRDKINNQNKEESVPISLMFEACFPHTPFE